MKVYQLMKQTNIAYDLQHVQKSIAGESQLTIANSDANSWTMSESSTTGRQRAVMMLGRVTIELDGQNRKSTVRMLFSR